MRVVLAHLRHALTNRRRRTWRDYAVVGALGVVTLALVSAATPPLAPGVVDGRALVAASASLKIAPSLREGPPPPAPLASAPVSAPPAAPVSPALRAAFAKLTAGDAAGALALAATLADKGDAEARHFVGYLYEKGLGVDPDLGRAMAYYSEAAAAGSVDAQVALGLLALEGDAVSRDPERAAGWFRLAADRNDPRALVQLGLMQMDGVGLPRDRESAARLFAKAEGLGDADGAYYLGLATLNGDGVRQDTAEAARLLAAAAAKRHGEAAYHLALMHDSGALGRVDAKKAVALMQTAVDAGFPPAFAGMGLMAHRGDAEGHAADWFEKGAAAGDAQGALLLAVAYSKGDGRPKDPARSAAILEALLADKGLDSQLRANAIALQRSLDRKSVGALTLRD